VLGVRGGRAGLSGTAGVDRDAARGRLCHARPLGGTAFAQAPFEPNDSPGTASGPLAPGTYSAAIETDTDRDLFRIYIAARQQQVTVNMTNTAPSSSYATFLFAGLYNSKLESLDSECSLSLGESADLGQTLKPGVYYIGFEEGCLPLTDPGASYRFTVAGALVDEATMATHCAAADARLDAARKAFKRARKQRRRAHDHGNAQDVKKARKRLRAAKKERHRAKRAVRLFCVTG
jgi:hypothetical protein